MGSGSEEVPTGVLAEFPPILTKELCFRIAPKLGCDYLLIQSWGADSNTAESFARNMLTEWKARDPPNQRSALGQAFEDVGMRVLYNHLEEKCEEWKKKQEEKGRTKTRRHNKSPPADSEEENSDTDRPPVKRKKTDKAETRRSNKSSPADSEEENSHTDGPPVKRKKTDKAKTRRRNKSPPADSEEESSDTDGPPVKRKKTDKGDTTGDRHSARHSWCANKISRDHITELEKSEVALSWRRIARRLKKEEEPGKPYAFSDADIKRLSQNNGNDDQVCFREMINTWIGMSTQHTVGFLYDALKEENFGRYADEILHPDFISC